MDKKDQKSKSDVPKDRQNRIGDDGLKSLEEVDKDKYYKNFKDEPKDKTASDKDSKKSCNVMWYADELIKKSI